MHRYRSHNCAQLRTADVGTTVRLSGWVHRVRDHGGLLFIDLRDHYGITQIVADPDSPCFAVAERVRGEWLVRVDGTVKARTPETVNPNLPTGEVEVFAREMEVLSQAKELPLPVFGEPDYPEDIRLKYRFLDLRRETLHRNIMTRTRVVASMRRRMVEAGFSEFQTPILTASSPEGARDFLVPSRLHPGEFYALPQAPQIYKQLLMVSGFDRYFQIAPCFRDEDPRADRFYGEFYQLDVEMSFVEQDEILSTMEPVFRGVFEEFAGARAVDAEWPRIPYDEAVRRYGTDKPDLRNPIEMQEVSEHFRGSGFKVFANILANDDKAEVWAVPARTGGSRAFCDRMNSWAQGEGQPGLGYIFWRREGEALEGAGPIAKNIGAERTEAIRQQLGLADGDACFFVAGDPRKFAPFAGAARVRAAEELGLVDESRFALCWIVDFPFYEWDEDEKRIDFGHNPFSMPQGGMQALETQDPLTIKAFQYDLVCNGFEIVSGGIRNHLPDLMVKAFGIVGLSQADVEERFGGLYRAFQYGAPPHGGLAAGIDRIVMLICGAKNLRDVALFPMNQQGVDLLMGAPSKPSAQQLRELHLRAVPPKD
ncbi:aspartate--tRNA ligase [Aquibium sp. A9E412]|uniref:aspartate--tRNA ligase n=1 Tax=Aquibium sp. A9E412 TaxID=2976767 RepID=UPI0025AF9B5C|nr:aspartate--tRNA ligase [Aquibium sp. A9E412]MDN2564975.1 aspartate--tRNA ligase [Aquibium sp. A9E412]